MSLSLAPSATLGWAPLALVLLAMLAYALAMRGGSGRAAGADASAAAGMPLGGPGTRGAGSATSAAAQGLPAPALAAGWLLHAALLALDIGGWGRDQPGARLGFGPVLSLTVWLVLGVHALESRFLPLPQVRRALGLAGLLAVPLAWAFPGAPQLAGHALAPLHWVLGVGAYALLAAAVLHATMLDTAERQLRQHGRGSALVPAGPLSGLPLLKLERITFRFVEAGFGVLSLALLLGLMTAARWQWSHKNVLSVLAWAVLAALLVGRRWRGWRGRRATRWLYAGAVLLLLAYGGSRFVLEVLLGRA